MKNNIIEQRIEQIASSLDEGVELDYTTLLEGLSYYFEHPLNLNNATPQELQELYMLSDFQINNLQRHIAKYGDLKSIYELQAVQDFDLATIHNIQYFVTANPVVALGDISLRTFFREASNDLFLRYKRNFQESAGFKPDPETGTPDFQGSPDYMYTRYKLQFRKSFRAGFTLEKDAGESLEKGPDFYSFHAMYTGQSWLRKLVVGDYQALFGQGLTFWNGLAFGKSAFVLNVKRNGVGLKPYSSVQEGNYLRGAATTIGFGKVELTGFYSSKKLDGNVINAVDTVYTDDEAVVSSIQLGGLHRTASEIADKRQLGEVIYGGNIKYATRAFSIGATAAKTEYDKVVQPTLSLYENYKFTGSHNLNLGVDYQLVLRNANFFGEFSRSENGGLAAVNGLVAAIHPRLSVSIMHRWYGRDYQSLHSNVFGENNTTANNEQGLFAALLANLTGKWTLTAYSDLVKFPWLRFRVDAPGNYTDYLAQLNYKPDRKHEFYFRYRHRLNEQNSGNENLIISYPVATDQHNFRIHGVYQAHPNVQMKTRVEWSSFKKEGNISHGFLLYQDVIFKRMGSKVSYTLRYAVFDAKDWNSRIYAFETDVLYAFSILPYYGKGSRIYAMAKVDIARGLDLWVRYGTWVYTDRNVISSGSSEISGNKKSDIHLQLRLQF